MRKRVKALQYPGNPQCLPFYDLPTQPTNMAPFTCQACTDDFEKGAIRIDGNKICPNCLRHIFELALKDEADYPAHWGTTQLDRRHYRNIIGRELYERYKAKEIEYACPTSDRVYCARTDPPRRPDRCGGFIGRWDDRATCVRCEKCMWYTCIRCEESFSTGEVQGSETTIDHICDPSRESEINARALQGLARGKDYQICPACQRPWALWDGCNHMRCTCKAHFCFSCGAKVGQTYRHWRRSRCPLYNSAREERVGNRLRRPLPDGLPIAEENEEWLEAQQDIMPEVPHFLRIELEQRNQQIVAALRRGQNAHIAQHLQLLEDMVLQLPVRRLQQGGIVMLGVHEYEYPQREEHRDADVDEADHRQGLRQHDAELDQYEQRRRRRQQAAAVACIMM